MIRHTTARSHEICCTHTCTDCMNVNPAMLFRDVGVKVAHGVGSRSGASSPVVRLRVKRKC